MRRTYLGQRRSDNNHVVRVTRLRHLLDEQVHHPPQVLVGGLKELGDSEEDGGGLHGGELVALEEEGEGGRDGREEE